MEYISQAFAWLWRILDIPAILLFAMIGLVAYALRKSQADPSHRFNFADFFLDDQGKASVGRLANFICMLIAGWVLVYMVIKDPDSQVNEIFYIAFIVVFSGQRVAEKLIDAWAHLRHGHPVPQPRMNNDEQANQGSGT